MSKCQNFEISKKNFEKKNIRFFFYFIFLFFYFFYFLFFSQDLPRSCNILLKSYPTYILCVSPNPSNFIGYLCSMLYNSLLISRFKKLEMQLITSFFKKKGKRKSSTTVQSGEPPASEKTVQFLLAVIALSVKEATQYDGVIHMLEK